MNNATTPDALTADEKLAADLAEIAEGLEALAELTAEEFWGLA